MHHLPEVGRCGCQPFTYQGNEFFIVDDGTAHTAVMHHAADSQAQGKGIAGQQRLLDGLRHLADEGLAEVVHLLAQQACLVVHHSHAQQGHPHRDNKGNDQSQFVGDGKVLRLQVLSQAADAGPQDGHLPAQPRRHVSCHS